MSGGGVEVTNSPALPDPSLPYVKNTKDAHGTFYQWEIHGARHQQIIIPIITALVIKITSTPENDI